MADNTILRKEVHTFLKKHPEVIAEELPHVFKDHPDVLKKPLLSIFPDMVVEYPDLIIKRLPEAIKIHPEVKEELYTIISERYVTKIEIREILDEMRKEREEWTRRFEQQREESNRRFEQQRKELIQLREDTNARFEAIIHEMKEFRKEMREELQKTRKDLLTELEIRISTIGSRWGEFTEETLRNTLKRLLSERFKITKIEKWETEDEEGYVFNIPQKIEGRLLTQR